MGFFITFQPSGTSTYAPEKATILEAAREAGLALNRTIEAPCGGQGRCGGCRVKIVHGETSEPTEAERRFLSDRERAEHYRLACQTVPLTALVVEADYLDDRARIELSGLETDVDPDPPFRHLEFPPLSPDIGEPASQWDRICGVLQDLYGIVGTTVDPELLRRSPGLSSDISAVVTLRDKEIINFRPKGRSARPLGLAVDLGTTKIAGYLVDLASGAIVASEGIMNPQLPFGGDVMSRLAAALKDPEDQSKLGNLLIEALQELGRTLTDRTGAVSGDIEEVVVAGNTAMHHLLLNLPVDLLARAPYVPKVSEPILIKARDMCLDLAPGTYVYMIPPIGGFVGGDHVAMILAAGLYRAKVTTLGLDIGTNTEIVLAHEGKLVCCSCASGPAFEGGHLSCGMRAAEGALARLRLGPDGYVDFYHTIGGGRPLGICGSGSLDALSEMARLNIVNSNGLLDRSHPLVRESSKGAVPEFRIFTAEESGSGADIVMTQRDISEVQLAKAAIAAGIELLMAEERIVPQELGEVLVSGAFGSWLNPGSAVSIGMLPDVPLERIRQVGNAAGAGAIRMLVSLSERRLGEKIARSVGRLDLATHPEFGGAFAKSLRFASGSEDLNG